MNDMGSDRSIASRAEERCKNQDDRTKISNQCATIAFQQKMDGFETQMANIRARLEAKRELASSQHTSIFPKIVSSSTCTLSTLKHSSSLNQLNLPLLRQTNETRAGNARHKDPFSKVEIESARVGRMKEAKKRGEEALKSTVSAFLDGNNCLFERRTSSYRSQALHSDQEVQPELTAFGIDEENIRGAKATFQAARSENVSTAVLPSKLAAIVKNEHDFRSMQQVGSWLGRNEANERYERMLAIESANNDFDQEAGFTRKPTIDSSSLICQESREAVKGDVAESCLEYNAPLCREWVLFTRCSRKKSDKSTGITAEPYMERGCLQRHFYLSFQEKHQMMKWAQTKESWLEKNVLAVIIEREAQIERVYRSSHKCIVQYQQNRHAETKELTKELLIELNRIRFLTVKVLETIDQWRQHAREIGYARYDVQSKQIKDVKTSSEVPEIRTPLRGWSVAITLDTEKKHYKGSKAFLTRIKRFRRIIGSQEKAAIYLGCYQTQGEAERAYDERAASEARRLNTSIENMPRRRNVFRSCGNHFAVESEKEGPSFCIECKTNSQASATSHWIPPFLFGSSGNYIMKMTDDLDFLDEVVPLKALLNHGRGIDIEAFPMRGNVFLLPMTSIQNPDLAFFTTLSPSLASQLKPSSDFSDMKDVDCESVDKNRILKAQVIIDQELHQYRPNLATALTPRNIVDKSICSSKASESSASEYRLVNALYWDHCAAIKILQKRAPLAMRQQNVWCRPDAGEWSSLVVRGAHRRHYLFEDKLDRNSKESMQRRQQLIIALRRLIKVPLHHVQSRTSYTELIAAGQHVHGDVVQLEVNNTLKRLKQYDVWCRMALVAQRWFRGELGRRRARAMQRALHLSYKLRVIHLKQLASVAKSFYESEVWTEAIRRASKQIRTPVYTRAVSMDAELVIVTFHTLRHDHHHHKDDHHVAATKPLVLPSTCCSSCARTFHVKCHYQAQESRFTGFRGVCTCSWNGGSNIKDDMKHESWLIRAYNPRRNVTYRLQLQAPQLRQLMSQSLYPHTNHPRNHSLISNMETKQLKATAATRCAEFWSTKAKSAAQTLANWRRMHTDATCTRKSLKRELENSFTVLHSTKAALIVATSDAKKSLDSTSRPFFEAQAWDSIENANDRTPIVEKRQLTKRLEEAHQDVERLRFAHFQAVYNERYTHARVIDARNLYDHTWLPIMEHHQQVAEKALLVSNAAKKRMESVMAQLCERFLTLRDCNKVPIRRHLILQSPTWHNMAPHRIDIPGLRRNRNYLRRRTVKLSSVASLTQKTWRMVITVSISSIGNYACRAYRDFWITAYDPVDCSEYRLFLEYELVQLLIGSSGKRLWQDSSQSQRSIWRAIAKILISITMLDRFTGEFTLQKLMFYQRLRQLSPRFLSSKVMQDLQRGRKCGQGDVILRQTVAVDGKLCVVVVYENWGDLTFAMYHAASGDCYRLVVSLHEVFRLLSQKPLMLRLWIYCVKSNSYSPPVLVYLLKYVRFSQLEDGCENVRIEHDFAARSRSKPYQTVLQVQKRQILVRIIEDSAGDFHISGDDMNSELTYKLLVERESLHRILKTCAVPTDSEFRAKNSLATSSSALLLGCNRKLLYEWMCSRLRFQSMLEHPDRLTSGSSPFLSGLHLRESFQLFSTWIATSPRNPIQAVAEAEITRRASAIDAALFSSLQFDQLSLIANPRLPFELDKKYVGTMDWIETVVASSSHSQAWQNELPFMRVDFFIKAHTLFARLRKELIEETKERRRRETWSGMEKEDHNALCLEISSVVHLSHVYITERCQQLSGLCIAATKYIEQSRLVHSQLRAATRSTEVDCDFVVIASTLLESVRMLEEDSHSSFVNLLHSWIPTPSTALHDFILLAGLEKLWYPVKAAKSLLQTCLRRFDLELRLTLSNIESTIAHIANSNSSLDELWMLKKRLIQFFKSLTRESSVACVITQSKSDETVIREVKLSNMDLVDIRVTSPIILPGSLTMNNHLKTGLLIPNRSSEPIDEIFIADMPTWGPSEANLDGDYAQSIIKHSRLFFQQQCRQRDESCCCDRNLVSPNDDLVCQRVPFGVLVHKNTAHNAQLRDNVDQYNARGAALTGNINLWGPAIFWPLQDDCGWYQRLLDSSNIFTKFITSSRLLVPQNVSKKQGTVRSTKYLPWKQFAIQRLRTSQAVKRSRTREVMCIDSLNSEAEAVEKDKRTVTTFAIDFQQLKFYLVELTLDDFQKGTHVTEWMKHFFAMHQENHENGSTNETNWRVSINNAQMLRNALDIYDSDGNAIRISRVICEDKQL